ncbi:MAG: peptidoglycan editing factor PgeF [Alphaproteobacteria bacterium]|nr:peptidoglycan editing factor PgeF [Alphaproteobacteria bacterium]
MNVSECQTLAQISAVRHGFFGRQGGVSHGIFSSLNCGYGSGDDPELVRENRTRVGKHLGVDHAHVLSVYQIHSPEAVVATETWAHGAQPKADAMATSVPGLALSILTADCAPILFADAEAKVIGAAHAGWKGALGGVVESAVGTMERLGARRERIVATVGPCITQPSYEVGDEFRTRFVDARAANAKYFAPGQRAQHWQFDLPGYVRARLSAMGLKSVGAIDRCTYAESDAYFSFRRTTHRGESDYGRNLSAIVLTS